MPKDNRTATVERKTSETEIKIIMGLDGIGESSVDTGIGFFDHMLQSFARHGKFDLYINVEGDLEVDGHHTVEDVGICLGSAIKKAAGKKTQIRRFGSAHIPMDESLVLAVVDLGGRAFFSYQGFDFKIPVLGVFETELVEEFFRAVTVNAGLNLHIHCLSTGNAHHMIEASFKAFARALDYALEYDVREKGVPSTKGSL